MKSHIFWIVFVKIVFILLSLFYFFIPNTMVKQYKDSVETVFFISMAILIRYMFNPYTSRAITIEEKQLLFLFGVVILITANWSTLLSTARTTSARFIL